MTNPDLGIGKHSIYDVLYGRGISRETADLVNPYVDAKLADQKLSVEPGEEPVLFRLDEGDKHNVWGQLSELQLWLTNPNDTNNLGLPKELLMGVILNSTFSRYGLEVQVLNGTLDKTVIDQNDAGNDLSVQTSADIALGKYTEINGEFVFEPYLSIDITSKPETDESRQASHVPFNIRLKCPHISYSVADLLPDENVQNKAKKHNHDAFVVNFINTKLREIVFKVKEMLDLKNQPTTEYLKALEDQKPSDYQLYLTRKNYILEQIQDLIKAEGLEQTRAQGSIYRSPSEP